MLDDRLLEALRAHPEVGKLLPEMESQVRSDVTTPVSAVNTLIKAFLQD